MCRSCKVQSPGIKAFSFPMLIAQFGNDSVQLEVKAADDKAGTSLFGMSAAAFDALTEDQQADAIEDVHDAPYMSQFMIQYKPDQHNFFVTAWALQRLPWN